MGSADIYSFAFGYFPRQDGGPYENVLQKRYQYRSGQGRNSVAAGFPSHPPSGSWGQVLK